MRSSVAEARCVKAGTLDDMKRPLPIILAIVVLVVGLLSVRGRLRAKAEAELWAEATDEL